LRHAQSEHVFSSGSPFRGVCVIHEWDALSFVKPTGGP
jgi:hypothetical protein